MSVASDPKAGAGRPSARFEPAPAHSHRAGLMGIGWSSLAQLVGMVIRLGSNLVLTRFLAPEAYGLFGTAMAIVTTLEWLSDLGVQPALVRHAEGDKTRYLITGWWINLSRGGLLSTLMACLAWPLAAVYGQPTLGPVIAALALRPVLFALKSPGMPLLRRNLNYRALFVDEVMQTIVATAVSLTLAYLTHSLWSIVAGTVAGTLASAIVSYALSPIRPKAEWDREASREIAGFGRSVFVNTMVMAVWLNLDRLIGLRLVGDREMGFYAVAWNLASVAESLMSRACDVYFSMLSRKPDAESQATWHAKVVQTISIRLMPLLAVGVALGPFVIGLLYDKRYAGAKFLFAILVARLMVRGLGQVQFQYLMATARVGVGTKAYVVAMLVQVAILFPLVRAYGVLGMALAALASTTALTAAQTVLMERMGDGGRGPYLITCAWAALGLGSLFFLY